MGSGLEERIKSFSNQKLLEILNSKPGEYTDEALLLASEEIKRREETNSRHEEIHEEILSKTYLSVNKNTVSFIFKLLGFIEILAGILLGVYVWLETETFVFVGFVIISSGLISGILFIGIGEIINILHQINAKNNL